jgi:hypothetical protein
MPAIKTSTVTVGGHGGCLPPDGTRVADADDITFRGHCKRLLPHYDAHMGRQDLEAAYGEQYSKIAELGAAALVNEWFSQNEGS